ncbi:MAG: trypsin-like serine protease [Clostridia bacterium]|nr:trypsin-like serine protease [Clostridia bacterium]
MNKINLIKKLFYVLIIIFVLQFFIININVNAYSEKNIVEMPVVDTSISEEELLKAHEEEKIMKIDATTGQTTEYEIDYDKISPILEEMKKTQNISTDLFLENNAKISYENVKLFKNSPMLLSNNNYNIYLNNEEVSYLKPICRITADEIYRGATGFLIGDKYLVTAAHCVLKQDGSVYGHWSAFAGYNNGSYLRKMGWNTVHYSSNWSTYGGASDFDWAIVELDGNYGSSIGWLPCTKYYNYSDMVGVAVKANGYPGESMNGERLCNSSGKITSSSQLSFNSSCQVEGGFSGGPTCLSDYTACGINVGKYEDGTLKSIRFDDGLYGLIVDLLNK